MKIVQPAMDFPNLLEAFPDRNSIDKTELRQLFQFQTPGLTEQGFRRILYSLEKKEIIMPIGAGVYALLNSPLAGKKKKFIPSLSPKILQLNSVIKKDFPYTNYLIWETNILHELMIHQPGNNLVILEVERDACESVFNRLIEQRSGNVFLEPDQITYERYIINVLEGVILLRLITQSPKLTIEGISTAPLEKILVDIFADEDHFYAYQGQEMVNIYENAFSMYWINEKTLFRYASRRKVTTRLKKLMLNHFRTI